MARRTKVLPFQPDPTPSPDLIAILGDIEANTAPATDWKITRISAPVPNAALSHVFTTGTKRFSMKPDNGADSDFKVAKTALLLATEYSTVPAGNELAEDKLLTPAGFTIHFSCSSITTMEIKEWF